MCKTDYLRIGEHKIFKELFESLPKNVSKTLNLIAIRDSVLFSWDFQNNCVLSLNVKAARNKQGDNVIHQKLLPLRPPLFSPELIVVNESGTLLAVAGPNGVLVLQLPARCPPYGAFDNNKDVVYCRSYSIDERLLSCNEIVQVRQVKFHPGSTNDSHILVLTSDNNLRLYQIENNEAVNLGIFPVGEKPGSVFPGSKTLFLDLFGEVAVDFDFGHPEMVDKSPLMLHDTSKDVNVTDLSIINGSQKKSSKITPKEHQNRQNEAQKNWKYFVWPIYILRGDCSVYSISIDLNKLTRPVLKGPLAVINESEFLAQACSLVCLNTYPQILSIAVSNGTVVHSLLLDVPDDRLVPVKDKSKLTSEIPNKELIVFETIELELGLTTCEDEDEEKKYKCPLFLHKDDYRTSRYFVTHSAGVHLIDIGCVDELHNYINGPEDVDPSEDMFTKSSSAEYLLCTKAANSEKNNPVIGFSVYNEPPSIVALLADKTVVTLMLWSTPALPNIGTLSIKDDSEVLSPMKKMLNQPFDEYIRNILKPASTQPVLKLSSTAGQDIEESYEIFQRVAQVLRENYFKQHMKAKEEIEKRIKTLSLLKEQQLKEVERMTREKEALQANAENLAEKYEDTKDKQDELQKRCEQLLMLVSRKRSEPSDAEKEFMRDLNIFSEKAAAYGTVIDKVKEKMKYQQIQMENWKAQETKKIVAIPDIQSNTIKANLEDTTKKVSEMVRQVNEFKRALNMK